MFLLTCLVLVWLYYLWSRRRFYKVYLQLPGPLGLPFIGVGLKMMKPEKFLYYLSEETLNYKTPVISWMGPHCFLYLRDPETIETVLNSSSCTDKGEFYRFMSQAIGDGLFTSNSPRWDKHRRLLNPAFSRPAVHGFLPIFNQEANVLLHKLLQAQNQPLEIYGLLKKTVLETSCQTTMGKKMNLHSKGSTVIFDSYNSLIEICVTRMLSPWLYPDFIFRLSSLYKCQKQVTATLSNFVANLLQPTSKNTVSEDPTTGGQAPTVQHNSVNHIDDSDDEFTTKSKKSKVFVDYVRNYVAEGQLVWDDVIAEANVTVTATFETTSTALYLVCLCLAMHPECQDKLYQELVEIFPSENDDELGSLNLSEVTLKQIERMTYTEMVIKEALRLFAPVPVVTRNASADLTLKSGIVIPQGTEIGIDIFNLQRSFHVWGPHARCFKPELHFGPTSSLPHPFAFIPFTTGLRMCIGYRYALLIMKVMIAKIFRNFRIETHAQLHDLQVKGTISLKLCDYPLCTVEQRSR